MTTCAGVEGDPTKSSLEFSKADIYQDGQLDEEVFSI